MEKELKDIVARRVDSVGVELATRMAIKGMGESIIIHDENDGHVTQSISRLKFHLAVLEYLYCDSDEVDSGIKEKYDN
jgi:hypothetical protein